MAVNLSTKTNTTNPISAEDINHRLGNNATDTLSIDSFAAKDLYFHPQTTTIAISYQGFKNKTEMTTGKYFSTIGFIGNFQGVSDLGNLTEKNANSAENGGWYWNDQSTTAFIKELYWSTTSSTNAYAFRPMKNVSGTLSNLQQTQGWTIVVIRKAQQGTPYTKPLYRTSSYASFTSSSSTWKWTSSVGGMTTLGESSGLTRHVELL